jgi:NAD(P)-dependent dehydrogenase (short-subunit alcohol dehydrogenase family)
MAATPPVALITGASSGIGRATAELLAARGFQVFGTSRAPAASSGAAYAMLALDVRSERSVAGAVGAVLEAAGRVDLLVNNAGTVQAGAIEETSIAEVQGQLDTNVFGALRMIQAVLPHMRRQGSGQIINVGSILGHVAPPFIGTYATSKFALEGLTEALRAEVEPFGIRVSLIEPAFVKTNLKGSPPLGPRPEYHAARKAALERTRARSARAIPPEEVARAILRIATTARPGLHHFVGRSAALLITLKRFLPEPAFERVRRRLFAAPRSAPRRVAAAPGDGRGERGP